MENIFDSFEKRKEYLICVDSDGCAIDSMDIKHYRCFGPCMVAEWNLKEWEEPILSRWNDINLYTKTRGINRFKGLSKALQEIHLQYTKIEDLTTLVNWVETTNELSNNSLIKEIEKNPDSISLKKALSWSNAVNENIKKLPEEEILPFGKVKEALTLAHIHADVAVVSSANLGAVLDEWRRHELLPQTDIVLAQNAGTKAYCIEQLLTKGYNPKNVVMCGDALGDMEAAKKNGVNYFPILVRHEKESWEEFINNGLNKLMDGSYNGKYQEQLIESFLTNLGE